MIMGKFYYNAILVITTRYQLFNPEAAWEKLIKRWVLIKMYTILTF